MIRVTTKEDLELAKKAQPFKYELQKVMAQEQPRIWAHKEPFYPTPQACLKFNLKEEVEHQVRWYGLRGLVNALKFSLLRKDHYREIEQGFVVYKSERDRWWKARGRA